MPQGEDKLGLELAEAQKQLKAAQDRVAELEAALVARVGDEATLSHAPPNRDYHIFDKMLEGCLVIGFDWRYLYINDAAARHGAQAKEALLGCTVMEKYPGVEQTEIFDLLRRCMDERVPLHGENQYIYPDGTDAWFELSIQPVPEGIFVLTLDISKHRRAQIELQRQAAELEQRVQERTAELQAEKRQLRYHAGLQENVADAVMVTDLDFRIQSWNRAAQRIYGWTSDEVFDKSAADVLRTQFADDERTRVMMRFREQGWWEGEVVQHRKDGTPIHILGAVTLIKDENNNPIGIVSINHDITERKRTEDALRQALEREKELGDLKSRFVSMASHEFRTPLASILAVTETLSAYRHKLTEEQIDARFDKIKDQINHLKAIMEDVLLVARMQARRVEFAPALLDLDALCRSVLDEFISQPKMAHVIEYECAPSLKQVMLDKKLVRQVISNLVANALKYSPDGTTVNVSLRAVEGEAIIKISDQGIGIPEADQKHLFEPFHRAANVGTVSGTGLGLVIAKESVELHGGSIAVESQVGSGTTFLVRFPISSNR